MKKTISLGKAIKPEVVLSKEYDTISSLDLAVSFVSLKILKEYRSYFGTGFPFVVNYVEDFAGWLKDLESSGQGKKLGALLNEAGWITLFRETETKGWALVITDVKNIAANLKKH